MPPNEAAGPVLIELERLRRVRDQDTPKPTFGDTGYPDYVADVHRDGHVTTGEALVLKWLHDLVLAPRAEGAA